MPVLRILQPGCLVAASNRRKSHVSCMIGRLFMPECLTLFVEADGGHRGDGPKCCYRFPDIHSSFL